MLPSEEERGEKSVFAKSKSVNYDMPCDTYQLLFGLIKNSKMYSHMSDAFLDELVNAYICRVFLQKHIFPSWFVVVVASLQSVHTQTGLI